MQTTFGMNHLGNALVINSSKQIERRMLCHIQVWQFDISRLSGAEQGRFCITFVKKHARVRICTKDDCAVNSVGSRRPLYVIIASKGGRFMDSECNFTIGHYKYLISEALHSGYKFCSFNEPTLSDQRVIFLRHDIDVSIDMALKMAEVETELGVRSTYFALPNCSTYNLLEDASLKKLVQIAEMGHWIGLHIDLPCTVSEAHAIEEIAYAMFVFYANFLPLSPVVSFHRPQPQIFTIKLPTLVNTYEDRFFK